MRDRPSAPASWQALAMAVMSVTLGESFRMTGFLQATALTARVTWAAMSGSVPKASPPCLTLGQEMLTSSQPTCWQRASFSATMAYSSTLLPQTFAITGL